jgi:hypothetical protein
MDKLPDWPKQLTGEFTLTSGWLAANYERAMKEAYAARLRVAVEACREIATQHPGCEGSIAKLRRERAEKAIADIGELPT